MSDTSIEQRLDALAREAVGAEGPSTILGVRSPLHGIDHASAAGHIARGERRAVTTTHGFRIASQSKTITAFVLARLVEEGRLRFDDRLAEHLPAAIVDRVWVDGATSRGGEITLAELLSHRAGLWDFALSRQWSRAVRADPGRPRTPAEILDFALEHGAPIGPPGAQYHYSDTGYVLLGTLLERLTGERYHALARRYVLDPLGIADTWLEGHEEPRTALSHPYAGDLDGLLVHGSIDWAAGGHVSTIADLSRLLRGLFQDGLVRNATLDRMLTASPAPPHRYGLGIRVMKIDGVTLWGHSGFWGSFMFYAPAWRATIAGTLNRTDTDREAMIGRVVSILREA